MLSEPVVVTFPADTPDTLFKYYDDVISETNAAEMLMHEEENQELSVFLDEVLNSEEDTNYYALWIYYWEELRGESAPTRYVA